MRFTPILGIAILLLAGSFHAKDILQEELESYHSRLFQKLNKEQKEYENRMEEQLTDVQDNICTGGAALSSLSPREYLTAFIKGPCAPVIIVPGLTCSKLVAKIDCETLRDTDKETFTACGWNGCDANHDRPDDQYQLWLPDVLSPLSLLKPFGSSKKCFAGLFGLKVIGSGKNLKLVPKPGVEVRNLGSTGGENNTLEKNQCGFASMEDLVPKEIKVRQTILFRKMKERFLRAGYKIGLTFQNLPQDWRVDYRRNRLKYKFKNVLDQMFEMTGKKVVLIGHSFGNQQILNFLWITPQSEKDKKIARYIGMGPPLSGTVKALPTFLGMDGQFGFGFSNVRVGLDANFFAQAGFTFEGLMNLAPYGHYNQFKSKPFFKAILEKIEAEKKGVDMRKGTIMDLFPSITEECAIGFKNKDDQCRLHMTDMKDYGTLMGKPITSDNLGQILTDYSYSEHAGSVFRVATDPRLTTLPNPGVQTSLVYSNVLDSLDKIHYQKNPREETGRTKQPYDPEVQVSTLGDGAVTSSSALVAGIKWADEFKYKRVRNAKPVTFVELCSVYNRKANVFQKDYKVTDNEYMGTACSCTGTKKYRTSGSCIDHPGMLIDAGTLEFLVSSSMDYQTGNAGGKIGGRFASMSDMDIDEFQQKCVLFNQNE